MFRKVKAQIGGVELPEGFVVSSMINNVAISNDGRYAAVTPDGGLVVANIPADGRIEVDGTVITYQRGTGGSRLNIVGGIRMSSVSGSSVVISGRSCVSIGGHDLGYEIDQGYDGVARVQLKEQANDVNLCLSEDRKAYVRGRTGSEPEYERGRLVIDGLDGNLILPKALANLELDVSTLSGEVDGDVAHRGRIKSMSGDISIRLFAPVQVETTTMSGDVDVHGMVAEGRRSYKPITGEPRGLLSLETMSGDIEVRYSTR